MKLIVGLGNPGAQYQNSRHNVGFQLVDYLIEHTEGSSHWQMNKKIDGLIAKNQQSGIIYLKPQTFMNASGESVQKACHYYDINLTDVIVCHDDLDLELGNFKQQLGKGPKVHNGLLSIYQQLKTEQFWHWRIGIDGRSGQRTMPGGNYVLSNFTATEQILLQQTFQKIFQQDCK